MAEPVRQDYPRSEIIEHHAEFQQLLLDMAKRSAGGKTTSGRYKKYDSTRLLFLNTIAFPSLRLGKRIDPKDWRLLFLPITSRDDPGTCADKDELDRWCALHKKDPRSKSSQSYGLDAAKQTSILTWVANNTAGYVPPAQAPQAARVHAEFWSLRWMHLESARTRWNIAEAQAKSHCPGWADAAVDYIAFLHLALPPACRPLSRAPRARAQWLPHAW